MFILGIIVLVAALVALVFNLKISYETQCGGKGQDPVFGASIIQIPMLAMLGLSLIDHSGRLHLQGWHYPVIWLALAVCTGCLVALAGRCAGSGGP